MSRRAFVLPVVLLTSGAIALLAATIVVGATQRARQVSQHQAQVQAREWCLGARRLPLGSVLTVDGWRLEIDAAGAVSARDARGTWRIAADGTESWERRR